ncbi:DL-glycerol-3-phosphatase [Lecanora helva]
MADQSKFNGQPEEHVFAGFLFDLDGTLINTTEAITKHWQKIASELHTDPDALIVASRGRRSIDTMALYDPSKARWDYINTLESQIPPLYGTTASRTPGALSLLHSLLTHSAPWAIITSCTRALLTAWCVKFSLPAPDATVTAEDVGLGKPEPECYLLGRERIGVPAGDAGGKKVLVVEDSPSGVLAGKRAGCVVLGLATTHAVETVRGAGADWVVEDLKCLRVVGREEGGWRVCIERSFVEG